MSRRIGRSLNERYGVRAPLADARAILAEALPAVARSIIDVRAQGARMIACVIVRADDASVRLCRSFGFAMTPGGTGVFGLPGDDAARAFPELSPAQRRWLELPCGARETKVLLLAPGTAGTLSMHVEGGEVSISVAPDEAKARAHPPSSR